MLRPISIYHFLSFMRSKGYPEAELLQDTAIDAARLPDPDYFISREDHQVFLSNLIRVSGDKGVGLELGQSFEVAHFGVLAYTGLSCGTIRHGMESVWDRYGAAFGVDTRWRILDERPRSVVIEILAPRPNEPMYRFAIEEALCALLRIGGSLTECAMSFERIDLSYPKPSYGDHYHALFQCPVTFDAPRSCITMPRAWLDTPLKTTDIELNRLGRDYLERVLRHAEASNSVALRLRYLLLSRLGDLPSLEEAAEEFKVSSRTLARQLQQEGYSFRQLVEMLRSELAGNWLRTTDMTTKEIGFRLGFRDVAAFRRAFKEWTGQTVSAYCVAAGSAGRE